MDQSRLLNNYEFNNLYSLLPYERKVKVDKLIFYKDKQTCILAYLLLCYNLYFEKKIDYLKKGFVYNKYDKPNLLQVNIKFSISHSENIIICAFSNQDIGIDVQDIVEYRDEYNFILARAECDRISESDNKNITFTSIFSIKESYLKCLGIGLIEQMNNLDFSIYDDLFNCYSHYFQLLEYKNNCIVICTKTHIRFKIVQITIDDICQLYVN